MVSKPLTPEEVDALKESMRRCSPETIDAAISYRNTGNAALVPVIVTGILERFLEPEAREVMRKGGDSVLVFDDLGVDSLTMLEIVMLVEEVLQITMENEDLRDLRSIGDIRSYIARKLPVP